MKDCQFAYLEHHDGIAANDDHADSDFLAAGLLLQRVVEDDIEVDLSFVSIYSFKVKDALTS